MKFTYFEFENFKGIEKQRLDLTKSSGSNIFTLVGLNESGKTTILEAINFFVFKPENLDDLKLDSYTINDIHDLIPISKRDNFNGMIKIEVGIELDTDDVVEIKSYAQKNMNFVISELTERFSYSQLYFFSNSKHIPEKNKTIWTFRAKGKSKKGRISKEISNQELQKIHKDIIIKNIPSILYFPNFLFEFPGKIFLNPEISDTKYLFYQKVIQDVLDSLNNDTKISDHLINRIDSTDFNERRNLTSLLNKMERKLTTVIFGSWNEIFTKNIGNKEIKLDHGHDEDNGPFLEFYIRDEDDTYKINERSLGFRWFFVYILLTQFRAMGKARNKAFFLFDEPASNLHPAAQSQLLKSFENLPNVLYTTHSHYLINPKWLESTFIVKNKSIDYNNEADYIPKNTNITILKYREFVSKFPSQTSYLQPVLEILDYKPSNLELVPKVVITEGKNDFYTYSLLKSQFSAELDKIKFIPGTSAGNLECLISLYLGWGADFVVLLDSDDQGKKEKKRYLEQFGEHLRGIILTYEDINPEWQETETEDLFSKEDKLSIMKIINPELKKFDKKAFNRAITELFVTESELSLDNISKQNFSSVFAILVEKLLNKSLT